MRIVPADIKWSEKAIKLLEDEMRVVLVEGLKYNPTTKKVAETGYATDLDLLVSYWYVRLVGKKTSSAGMQAIVEAKRNNLQGSFYLDSGVFTARKKGANITLDELIDFYHKHEETIDYVFNLDIGNDEEQLENARILKAAGVPVIPIFHGDMMYGTMDLDYISRMAEITPYIAVGLKLKGNLSFDYVDSIFEYIYKNNLWPLKVHALGTERFDFLSKYPFYSADSSTFASAYAFGRISFFDDRRLKIRNMHPKDEFAKAFKLDINSMKYIGNTGVSREERIYQNIMPRHEYQKFLTDLWAKKGIVWEK